MTTNDYAEPAAELTTGRMPLLGFGTWQIRNSAAPEAVAQALEAGYRHIDTATAYHNESGIGKALASSTLAREAVFVTTELARSVGPSRRACQSWAWTTSISGWCTGRPTVGQRRASGNNSSRHGRTGWQKPSASATTRCARS